MNVIAIRTTIVVDFTLYKIIIIIINVNLQSCLWILEYWVPFN